MDSPRVIEFVVSDGLHTNNPPARTTVNVLAFNDPPQVDLNGIMLGTNTEANYTEADSPTFILPHIEIYDQDSSVISEAYARINDVGSERLIISSTLAASSGISCLPTTCEGNNILLSGLSSLSNYQTVLRSLQYVNDIQIPNLRDRIIFVTISDGVSTSNPSATLTLKFVPLNNREVIQLNVPNKNLEVSFIVGQSQPIHLVSLVRIIIHLFRL